MSRTISERDVIHRTQFYLLQLDHCTIRDRVSQPLPYLILPYKKNERWVLTRKYESTKVNVNIYSKYDVHLLCNAVKKYRIRLYLVIILQTYERATR